MIRKLWRHGARQIIRRRFAKLFFCLCEPPSVVARFISILTRAALNKTVDISRASRAPEAEQVSMLRCEYSRHGISRRTTYSLGDRGSFVEAASWRLVNSERCWTASPWFLNAYFQFPDIPLLVYRRWAAYSQNQVCRWTTVYCDANECTRPGHCAEARKLSRQL